MKKKNINHLHAEGYHDDSQHQVQKQAVIIELNFKGSYERYALTVAEFIANFGVQIMNGLSCSNDEGSSFTVRPMVHIWCKLCDIGSEEWNTFFTDMSWGLSAGDIRTGNFASIRHDLMGTLKAYLPKVSAPEEKTTPEIESLKGNLNNLWHELDGIAGHPDEARIAPAIEKAIMICRSQLVAAVDNLELDLTRLEEIINSTGLPYDEMDQEGISISDWLKKNGLVRAKQ